MADLVAFKELLQPVFPLLGVVVGAAMTGFGQLYKTRQERKRILALALSDLLEVRHRVVTLNAGIRHLQELGKISAADMPHCRNLINQLIPTDAKLDVRFDEAVTLLAGIDPVFAFELRSKNLFPQFMNGLRLMATGHGDVSVVMDTVENKLIEFATTNFDEAVLRVAKQHSRKVYRDVQAVVATKEKVGERLSPFLSSLGIATSA
ncbi:hypothetical protein [Rhodoferax sp. U11-2br]|uniref:hypothetical protein n=1 Tax=Rhodoferax sp. U11-2br TaxID=2838878 RepID=UPI001BE702D3|nr:hypothetical protein [Rhodoferax sp. U11-2br]MBT3067964.1 hypothetical protein [Rhodoferax sp. U11-2br]